MDYIFLGFFLLLIVVSYYYTKSRKFWEGLFGLVLISYLQGILIALTFYRDDYFLLFTASVFVAMFYYLFFPKIVPLISVGRQMKKSSQSQPYSNEYVYSQCTKIWNIPKDKCLIRVFSGENSFNAVTNNLSLKFNILIGEKLIEALTDDEILFVLSHEIAHKFRRIRNFSFRMLFPFFYLLPCLIVAYALVAFNIATWYTFFISGIILFLIGASIINYNQWRDEYAADRRAVQTTNDIESAISAFHKMSDGINEADRNAILELLISDHPATSYRISKIQELEIKMEKT